MAAPSLSSYSTDWVGDFVKVQYIVYVLLEDPSFNSRGKSKQEGVVQNHTRSRIALALSD